MGDRPPFLPTLAERGSVLVCWQKKKNNMPRRPRLRLAGIAFHVIQRGNNRSPCFFTKGDYYRYLRDLELLSRKHRVAVHAYVLMTNHVHLLMTAEQPDGVPTLMKSLGQSYVQYINRRHSRTGSLWEGRFRSCLVDSEDYVLVCHRYIETNPVRAGMVEHPRDHSWSSYRSNAEGTFSTILSTHPVIEGLANTREQRHAAYRDLFREELKPELVDRIRDMTNGGFVLGSETFKRRVAQALNRQVTPTPVGRKKKPSADPGQPLPFALV